MSVLEPPDEPVAAPPGDDPAEPPRARRAPGSPAAAPSGEADEGDDADEVLAQYPPVVAVVVTRNPGPWLEDTLLGLAQQDYPDLTVLVVDCGSPGRPHRPGRRACCRGRSSVASATDAGFAEAANEALHAVEGATFLLVCHDDVVLDPPPCACWWRRRTARTPGSSGPSS